MVRLQVKDQDLVSSGPLKIFVSSSVKTSETSNTDVEYLASLAVAVSEVWTILIFLEPDRKVFRDARTER